MSEDDVIKKPNQKEIYTPEQELEIFKCSTDPLYFVENYVSIQHPLKGKVPFVPYPFQKDMIRAMHEQNRVICLTSRQMGKCISNNSLISLRKSHSPQKKGLTLQDDSRHNHPVIKTTIGDFYGKEKEASRDKKL